VNQAEVVSGGKFSEVARAMPIRAVRVLVVLFAPVYLGSPGTIQDPRRVIALNRAGDCGSVTDIELPVPEGYHPFPKERCAGSPYLAMSAYQEDPTG
jgi:hypothetical protein